MQADWEFELGEDAPLIDARWAGLIDLRAEPWRIGEITETRQFPPLADALAQLNARDSAVATTKCDYFAKLSEDEFDRDELDAEQGGELVALACYIDLMPSRRQRWATPEDAGLACRRLCALLLPVPLRSCRVDLVIRQTVIDAAGSALGVTAYLTACSVDEAHAAAALAATLAAFAERAALNTWTALPPQPI